MHTPPHYGLIVVGAGSGGFGAALAAARLGCATLLVERSESLGGNAARGGVNNWEPGVGGTGVPFDLYRELRRTPGAVAITSFGRHRAWQGPEIEPKFPGGETLVDPSRRYVDSLRRFGAPPLAAAEAFRREHWHGVTYEPKHYSDAIARLLAATGRCEVRLRTAFTAATADAATRRVHSLTLTDGSIVTADTFVDATADGHLVRAVGCRTSLGQEPRDLYGEPSAPVEPTDRLNGATLIYRVSRLAPNQAPAVESLPPDVPAECWWAPAFPVAFCSQYPNGDYNINSLPTISGREVITLGYPAALAECQRRIVAHWHHLQTVFPEFRAFRRIWVAPALGVREGPRLIGRYVLTEHDLIAGLAGQSHGDIVALADHARDTHGADNGRGGTSELRSPYGVPFRCLLPGEFDNLAVVGRGASFSSIGASSCRLSRTMMQLGQAAGTAAALARRSGTTFAATDSHSLRAALREQHVELDWPRPPDLLAHLNSEDA